MLSTNSASPRWRSMGAKVETQMILTAVKNGWIPIEGISEITQITHFPTENIVILKTDKGIVQLDDQDLEEARKYAKEEHGKSHKGTLEES